MKMLAIVMFFMAGNDLAQIIKITKRDGVNYAVYPIVYWVVFVLAALIIWSYPE